MNADNRHVDLPTSVVALAIAAVAAGALWQAREFSLFGSIFPLVVGGTLLLASLAVAVRGLIGRAPVKERPLREPSGMWNSAALVAVLLVWVLTLERLGFALSSWVCFLALALIADNRRRTLRRSVVYAIVAAVVVGGLQLLFQQVLNVRLP